MLVKLLAKRALALIPRSHLILLQAARSLLENRVFVREMRSSLIVKSFAQGEDLLSQDVVQRVAEVLAQLSLAVR